MHLDIYEPAGPINHRIAVLVHHGGGWAAGDRKMLQPQCRELARRGFTALAVEYRLLPEAPWPAQLVDVKTAIRWTLSHADELGIDPNKLVLQGHSAGAHLALVAAGTVENADLDPDFQSEGPAGPIAAVIAYYPPARLDPSRGMPDMSAGPDPAAMAALRGPDGSIPAAMLLAGAATEDSAALASPLTHAANLPPTVLFHGTDDGVVAHAASVALYEKLSALGIPSELHLMSGGEHAFDYMPVLGEVCIAASDAFLRRHIIDPRAFAEEEARMNPIIAMRRGGMPQAATHGTGRGDD
jgi:acetyl esterase/lipase